MHGTPKIRDTFETYHVATRDKTVMLGLRMLVLLTLHTFLNALVCCLQLNTERGADAI